MLINTTDKYENLFSKYNYNKSVYKYYSKDTIVENKYDRTKGDISFSHPSTFNDPFDCNIYFEDNKDKSDMFRVLCLTEDQNNILMWSYYADDHKGYCLRYDLKDIIKAVNELNLNGLCVIGEVIYSDSRPNIKKEVKNFSYTDIRHYIDVSFTKYKEWNHEREIRMVIISNDFYKLNLKNELYVTINVPVKNIIAGCKSDDYTNIKVNCKKQLTKSQKNYSLY